MNKKIFLIFIFAFLIRLIALNQSLWLDEAVTANVVRHYGFMQIISKFSPTDFHPPLYYLFMKLWTNVFGYSEIALRMPSVLFSLLTGWIIYKICRLRQDFGEPLWGAVFFLFNPLIVYYSQEARMYMLATFLLTVALYFFLSRKLIPPKAGDKHSILFGLFISLAFLTFYGSAFLIAAMFIYLLYKKQYKYFFISLSAFIVSLLIISSLLYQQFIHSRIALSNVANWSLVLGKANLKDLLLIPIKFSIGRISFYPKWLYWGIAGAWTGFVMYQILKTKNIYLFVYLFIFPLVLGFGVSFFAPMLQYFRFLYLIPIMALLLGLALSSQPTHNLRGYVLAGGFLIFSLAYLLNPAFHREDWKSLVKDLPKDKPVYMIKASSDPVLYYSNSLSVNELTGLRVETKAKEIIVIPYTSDIYGLDYKNILNKNGYQQIGGKDFRGLSFELWGRR